MRNKWRSLCFTAVIAIGLFAAIPATVFGGGPAGVAASPQPKPDVEKKVWTNDDFPATPAAQPAADSNELAVAALVTESPADQAETSAAEPVNPEQDPRFYILQMASLEMNWQVWKMRSSGCRIFALPALAFRPDCRSTHPVKE